MVPSLRYCLRLSSIGILTIARLCLELMRIVPHHPVLYTRVYIAHTSSSEVYFEEHWDEIQAMFSEVASALLDLVSSSEK